MSSIVAVVVVVFGGGVVVVVVVVIVVGVYVVVVVAQSEIGACKQTVFGGGVERTDVAVKQSIVGRFVVRAELDAGLYRLVLVERRVQAGQSRAVLWWCGAIEGCDSFAAVVCGGQCRWLGSGWLLLCEGSGRRRRLSWRNGAALRGSFVIEEAHAGQVEVQGGCGCLGKCRSRRECGRSGIDTSGRGLCALGIALNVSLEHGALVGFSESERLGCYAAGVGEGGVV